jgi:polyvinyl alcohol dehydrogenase (cytochrome)
MTCTACPAGRLANKEQTECVLASSWDHWGYDLTNRRWGCAETTLDVDSIANIQPKWTFTAGSDVTATPTISAGRLYVPDWSGKLWCLDAVTGETIWSQQIHDLVLQVDPNPYPTAPAGTVISRTSPAISGSTLVGRAR